MTVARNHEGEVTTFLRKRDYRFVRELGQGACGKTVLLFDDQIDEYFVCKKYQPYSESERITLYKNFVGEIKFLHQLHHPNVVRVFNYYLYPESFAGYILMEFVDGSDIEEFVKDHPEQCNELFVQAIGGFAYLERSGVLHRDVRPMNLLVTRDGRLKIIDLGFGKRVRVTADFAKSITLNWWCAPPNEFVDMRYDFATEVYFVGKLFERVVQENNISHFKYMSALAGMCRIEPSSRTPGFIHVETTIQSDQFFEIGFSDEQLQVYRSFADLVFKCVTEIENGAKYADDADRVQSQLNDAYRSFMLEEFVPEPAVVVRALLVGNFYIKGLNFPTSRVRDFVKLLKTSTFEQRRIIIANLHTKLNAIRRYSGVNEEDVPF